MNKSSIAIKTVATCVAFLAAAHSYAWDGATAGKISTIEATQDAVLTLRFYLDNGAALCSAGPTWAYVNPEDKVLIGLLLAAKLADKQVAAYTTNTVVGGSVYCKLAYLQVF